MPSIASYDSIQKTVLGFKPWDYERKVSQVVASSLESPQYRPSKAELYLDISALEVLAAWCAPRWWKDQSPAVVSLGLDFYHRPWPDLIANGRDVLDRLERWIPEDYLEPDMVRFFREDLGKWAREIREIVNGGELEWRCFARKAAKRKLKPGITASTGFKRGGYGLFTHVGGACVVFWDHLFEVRPKTIPADMCVAFYANVLDDCFVSDGVELAGNVRSYRETSRNLRFLVRGADSAGTFAVVVDANDVEEKISWNVWAALRYPVSDIGTCAASMSRFACYLHRNPFLPTNDERLLELGLTSPLGGPVVEMDIIRRERQET